MSWKDRPSYEHTGISEAEFPLAHQSGKSTKFLYEELLEYMVNFIGKRYLKGKSGFAILPCDPSDTITTHIRSRADFPEHQMEYDDYFEFENPVAFKPMNCFANKRTICFTMRIGAKTSVKAMVDKISHHLQADKNIITRVFKR